MGHRRLSFPRYALTEGAGGQTFEHFHARFSVHHAVRDGRVLAPELFFRSRRSVLDSVCFFSPPPTQKKSIQSAKRAQVILAGYLVEDPLKNSNQIRKIGKNSFVLAGNPS